MALVHNEGLPGTGNGTISGVMATGAAAVVTASSITVKARRNIYYTLSYTVLLHLVTWSGNQFAFVLYGFGYAINSATLAYQLPLLAIYTSSLINPIIYTIKYEQFRKAAISAFPGLRRHRDDTITLPTKHLHSALASF